MVKQVKTITDGDADEDPVMSLLMKHLAPLFPQGSTLTLIVDTGDGQEVSSNDSELEDLIIGLAQEMLQRMPEGGRVTRLVH